MHGLAVGSLGRVGVGGALTVPDSPASLGVRDALGRVRTGDGELPGVQGAVVVAVEEDGPAGLAGLARVLAAVAVTVQEDLAGEGAQPEAVAAEVGGGLLVAAQGE